MSFFRRSLLLLLALFLCLSLLCSCGLGGRKKVLSYGSQTFIRRYFEFALSLKKTEMLSLITGSTSSLSEKDDPAIWTTDAGDGETYGQKVINETLNMAKLTLFYCDFAEKQGITLTDEERAGATNTVNEMVAAFPSRGHFDSYMKEYDLSYEILVDYYTLDALATAGMRAYFQYPATSLTQADVRTYYEENYVTCIYLFANETNRTLENGKTVLLTDEEKAERAEWFDSSVEKIQAGEKLEDFLEGSNDAVFSDKKGKTFEISTLDTALGEKVKELEEGESAVVEGTLGRYFVLKLSHDETFLEENTDAFFLTLVKEREKKILEENSAAFEKNEKYFSKLSLDSIPVF